MANIPINDILTFKEERNSSRELLLQQYKQVKEEIKNRYADTVQRMGSTTDVVTLQRLDSFEKFLRSVSEQYDLQWIFIDRSTAGFNGIDDSYWNFVFNHEKLQQEIRFLKADNESLRKQRELLVTGWRSDRNNWRKDRIIRRNQHDVYRIPQET